MFEKDKYRVITNIVNILKCLQNLILEIFRKSIEI